MNDGKSNVKRHKLRQDVFTVVQHLASKNPDRIEKAGQRIAELRIKYAKDITIFEVALAEMAQKKGVTYDMGRV